MRVFFALALDEVARTAIAAEAGRVQQQLAQQGTIRAVKWVERENLHVTLRFLGEVDDARGAALADVMRPALSTPSYRLTLGRAGTFPAGGPPRVAWVGVGSGGQETKAVFERLDERLAPLGHERERRPYTPHVTLGRVRDIDRPGARVLREALSTVPEAIATLDVRAVTLYRSHLSSKGPRYEVLLETPLT